MKKSVRHGEKKGGCNHTLKKTQVLMCPLDPPVVVAAIVAMEAFSFE